MQTKIENKTEKEYIDLECKSLHFNSKFLEEGTIWIKRGISPPAYWYVYGVAVPDSKQSFIVKMSKNTLFSSYKLKILSLST